MAPAGAQKKAAAASAATDAINHRKPIKVGFGILRVRLKGRFTNEQGSARE
jgi:hypothetical protein